MPEGNPNVFFLIGKDRSYYHALGGSTSNLVGSIRGETATTGYSYFPHMVRALTRELSDEGVAARDQRREFLGAAATDAEFATLRSHEWADAIAWLYEETDVPSFEVTFLSRFLAFGTTLRGSPCTMNTPLYVALV